MSVRLDRLSHLKCKILRFGHVYVNTTNRLRLRNQYFFAYLYGTWWFFKVRCDLKLKYTVSPQGFKTVSLTSMELQMLTSSCIKLQTVHHIPLSINKEGRVTVFILSNIILCFLQTSFKLKIFISAYEAVLFTALVCLCFYWKPWAFP